MYQLWVLLYSERREKFESKWRKRWRLYLLETIVLCLPSYGHFCAASAKDKGIGKLVDIRSGQDPTSAPKSSDVSSCLKQIRSIVIRI